MTNFDPQQLAADILETRRVYADFLAGVSDLTWNNHTEPNGTGWTLRETVAHLDAVARVYQQMIDGALSGQPYSTPDVTRRGDLPGWNDQQIAARLELPVETVCNSFLDTLRRAADTVVGLSAPEMKLNVPAPVYNRDLTVAETFGGQAAHPGIVHAAQVANGAGVEPLWKHYSPGLKRRQITYFFHLMAHSYWPERGGDLEAAVNFVALGKNGGRWHLVISPAGCTSAEGKHPKPALTLWFRNIDILCRVSALQLNPLRATLTGQAWGWGNLLLGFKITDLFLPT